MLIIGHRGAAGLLPENTLRGVLHAIDLGVQWVEVDVWAIEGELFVFHDRRLEDLCSVPGLFSEQSIADIQSLRVKGTDPIPTLVEILDAAKDRVAVNIEMKGPDVVNSLSALLAKRTNAGDNVLVSSFDHRQLIELRKQNQSVRLAPLFYGFPPDLSGLARSLSAYSLNFSIDFLDQRSVDEAHAAGCKVFVYTVNEPDDIALMASMGVDGIFSDYPDRALKEAARLGQPRVR